VEVHTVSIPDNLSEPGLPYVDGVYRPLVCGTVRAMEGNAAGFYNVLTPGLDVLVIRAM
jgi:hypothetical protein